MSRKCEKCGVEDTKAKAQILKLPHVLVLQLKRLHMDRDIPCTKVSAPVKFTSRLDIGTTPSRPCYTKCFYSSFSLLNLIIFLIKPLHQNSWIPNFRILAHL